MLGLVLLQLHSSPSLSSSAWAGADAFVGSAAASLFLSAVTDGLTPASAGAPA